MFKIRQSLRGSQSGFSNIELAVLFIIICILSALILSTHKGINQKQDNTERQRDVDELRVELESYYSQYNQYPTFADVNNASWRAVYMKGLNKEVLHDPDGSSYQLVAEPVKNVYAYHVTGTNGKQCDNARVVCTEYTLTATLAGGGKYVKNNLD
jgi:type II secretory pathway pseudopilin PulG